jgi:hypothetical protein
LAGHLVGSAGLDMIHQWRRLIWCLIFAHVFYWFLGFISGEFRKKRNTELYVKP